MADLKGLRVGYVPYSTALTLPGAMLRDSRNKSGRVGWRTLT